MNKFIKWFIVILFALMIIIMIAANVRADDWKLSANVYKTIASDSESIVQSGTGLQISLHRKTLFLYLSKDINQLRFAGQSGPDINLWSAGIGIERKVGDYLMLSLSAGWYEPVAGWLGEPQIYPESPFAEGLCRYLNKFLAPDEDYLAWDYYSPNYRGGMGGKLTLDFEYPITNWLSFNMTTGYRYLKLEENIQGRNFSNGDDFWAANYWTVRYDRDFSGWIIGGVFTVRF